MSLTVIDVWAEWCVPCKMMDSILRELESEYPQVKFGKVNADEDPEFVRGNSIYGIPTLLFVKNDDTIVDRIVGVSSIDVIKAKIEKWK